MGALKFVGGTRGLPNELSTRGYVQNLLAGGLSQTVVNGQVVTRLSEYATKTYVDSRDGTLADSAFIDAADKTRLAKTALNTPGQPFTLDANGQVPVSKIKAALQQYPTTTAVGASPASVRITTSSEVNLFSVSVPDPGYPYKLLVTGSVHAGVSTDDFSYPQVSVYRLDGVTVARGYGIAESYQAPQLDSVGSRMLVRPFTPSQYPNTTVFPRQNTIDQTRPPLVYTTDWLDVSATEVNNAVYSTSLVGGSYLEAQASMNNVTLSAVMQFSFGEVPTPSGSLIAEMRIFSPQKGTLAATRSSGTVGAGTLTATANNVRVTKGDYFTIQVKQTVTASWDLFPGAYASWAPGGTNSLTLTPAVAPGLGTGPVSLLPISLTNQSTITGPTSLLVWLQSSGGQPVTAYTSPTPRLLAIPIPV